MFFIVGSSNPPALLCKGGNLPDEGSSPNSSGLRPRVALRVPLCKGGRGIPHWALLPLPPSTKKSKTEPTRACLGLGVCNSLEWSFTPPVKYY